MQICALLLSLFLLSACQSTPSPATQPESAAIERSTVGSPTTLHLTSKGITGQLLAPGDWLGQELEFAPYEKVRTQVEKFIGKRLKHRGEAHVTLITPPEMKVLLQSTTSKAIQELAAKMDMGNTVFDVVCIGRGVGKDRMETYFVVIKSPRFLEFREQVARLAQPSSRRLAQTSGFDPNSFYPHVTLGFTERDLHLQDGIQKNEKLCLSSANVQ